MIGTKVGQLVPRVEGFRMLSEVTVLLGVIMKRAAAQHDISQKVVLKNIQSVGTAFISLMQFVQRQFSLIILADRFLEHETCTSREHRNNLS